jgi:pantothenate kinase
MNLKEAKEVLNKNGYIVESEFDYSEDISREEKDAENEYRNRFYKLKEHLNYVYDLYESKSNDYINGHISPKKWESMKNTFKVEFAEVSKQLNELSE